MSHDGIESCEYDHEGRLFKEKVFLEDVEGSDSDKKMVQEMGGLNIHGESFLPNEKNGCINSSMTNTLHNHIEDGLPKEAELRQDQSKDSEVLSNSEAVQSETENKLNSDLDSEEETKFDLGALCSAAKQGDDILRLYIKQLSQKILNHDREKLNHDRGQMSRGGSKWAGPTVSASNEQSGQFVEANNAKHNLNQIKGTDHGHELAKDFESFDVTSEDHGPDQYAHLKGGEEASFTVDNDFPRRREATDVILKGGEEASFTVDDDFPRRREATDVIHRKENIRLSDEEKGFETHRPSERSYPPLKVASYLRENGIESDVQKLDNHGESSYTDEFDFPGNGEEQEMNNNDSEEESTQQRPKNTSNRNVPSEEIDVNIASGSFKSVSIDGLEIGDGFQGNNSSSLKSSVGSTEYASRGFYQKEDGDEYSNMPNADCLGEMYRFNSSVKSHTKMVNGLSGRSGLSGKSGLSGRSGRKMKSGQRPRTPEDHRDQVREYHMREKERRQSETNDELESCDQVMHIHEQQQAFFTEVPADRTVMNELMQNGFANDIMNIHEEDNEGDEGVTLRDPNSGNAEEEENESVVMGRISSFDPSMHMRSWKDDPQFAYVNEGGDNFSSHSKRTNGPSRVSFDRSENHIPVQDIGVNEQAFSPKGKKVKPSRPKSAKVNRTFATPSFHERRWASSAKMGFRRTTGSPERRQGVSHRARPSSACTGPDGDATRMKPMGRPKSAGVTRKQGRVTRNHERAIDQQGGEFLNVRSSQIFDGIASNALGGRSGIPPLTLQLIQDSPRESQDLSIWELLPDEILLRVFSFLRHPDLFKCALICRSFFRVAMDATLWRCIQLQKKKLTDLWLTQIGEKHPLSVSFVKCNGNNVSENGLRNLFRNAVDTLKELNISGCTGLDFTGDSVLLHASRCYNLTALDASWCSVTDNGLNAIVGGCNKLTSICLNGCPVISDGALRNLIDGHGENLTVLEIFGCIDFSPLTLARIGDKCTALTTLNIGQCYKITDDNIYEFIPKLKSLNHLDLRGVKQIRDDSVRRVVRSCKRLVSIVLANCTHVTNASLAEIASCLKGIRCLDVSGCKKVGSEGVRSISMCCSRLTQLNLSSTSIDRKSIMNLASYSCNNLTELKLNCCKDITEACIIKLLKHCKRLQTLHLYGVKGLRNLGVLKLQYPCIMYDGT